MKNKLILLLIVLISISSCSNMSGKRSQKSDEFLVEKKNPLVMPPDYDQLPVPEDFQSESINSKNKVENEIENIIKKSENKSSEIKTKKTDIGKSVLEKIN